MGMKVKNALAVYLHIPFCRVRCPYCDFNTYSGIQSLIPAYVEALCRVIAREGAASGFHAARTVYFGGGTPSLLEPKHVAHTHRSSQMPSYRSAADCEITLEANPVTADAEHFAGFRAAGVNRLSFGVQSFSDRLLKVLGRDHNAEHAKRALHLARQAGFENISLDLMYAVPNQSLADWQHDVACALALAPEHLSLYCLTVEASTPFARWVTNGRIKLPPDDIAADMYAYASECLAVAGYEHYEISNWALAGQRRAAQPKSTGATSRTLAWERARTATCTARAPRRYISPASTSSEHCAASRPSCARNRYRRQLQQKRPSFSTCDS